MKRLEYLEEAAKELQSAVDRIRKNQLRDMREYQKLFQLSKLLTEGVKDLAELESEEKLLAKDVKRRWSKEEDLLLLRYYRKSNREIGRMLGRTSKSVLHRRKTLGTPDQYECIDIPTLSVVK